MTFQPSEHSHNSYAGYDGPLVRIEHQFTDPKEEVGLFIADDNSAVQSVIGLGTMLAGGATAALSYRKNQSILWALGAWLAWPIVLPYYFFTGEITRD